MRPAHVTVEVEVEPRADSQTERLDEPEQQHERQRPAERHIPGDGEEVDMPCPPHASQRRRAAAPQNGELDR